MKRIRNWINNLSNLETISLAMKTRSKRFARGNNKPWRRTKTCKRLQSSTPWWTLIMCLLTRVAQSLNTPHFKRKPRLTFQLTNRAPWRPLTTILTQNFQIWSNKNLNRKLRWRPRPRRTENNNQSSLFQRSSPTVLPPKKSQLIWIPKSSPPVVPETNQVKNTKEMRPKTLFTPKMTTMSTLKPTKPTEKNPMNLW